MEIMSKSNAQGLFCQSVIGGNFYWVTEYYHPDNNFTMDDFLSNHFQKELLYITLMELMRRLSMMAETTDSMLVVTEIALTMSFGGRSFKIAANVLGIGDEWD